ncbi:hypothetical protein A4G19_03890 [Pasteurellaceae bacterium Macca]|nr:hypothetical protein [Pasteurellaceae bacterium Macca]
MIRIKLLTRLALRDLLYDRKISFCLVASLLAVIAPLLLLFSLKYGIVSQLQHKLLTNPRNLEIKIVGVTSGHKFDPTWFAQMAAESRVRFVIPQVRILNSQADFRNPTNNKQSLNVPLIPTAKGDPLLPQQGAPLKTNGIVLSALTAQSLGIELGQQLELSVLRQISGKGERQRIRLEVIQILPEYSYNAQGAFVLLPLLVALEDYIDGKAFDFQSIEGEVSTILPEREFAKGRLYVKELNDVSPMASQLRAQGIETNTQAAAIEEMQAIDSVLNLLFSVIAITAIIGCVLSLSGSFLANIERKRKDISLLMLFGFKPKEINVYLIIQAFMLASSAFLFALLLYYLSSLIVNGSLGSLSRDNLVSFLLPSHILIALLLTLFISCTIAFIGSRRALMIQPAESLREI